MQRSQLLRSRCESAGCSARYARSALGLRRRLRGDGQAPVRRIDDQRRPQIGAHPAAVEPERVVGTDAPRRRLAILGHFEVARGGLLLGVVSALAEIGRPLKRRERGVRPGALQIGIAPRRQRLAVRLGLSHGRHRQQHGHGRNNERHREGSAAHLGPSFRLSSLRFNPATIVPAGPARKKESTAPSRRNLPSPGSHGGGATPGPGRRAGVVRTRYHLPESEGSSWLDSLPRSP